ncbi:hypothetical protein EDC04DRAFT_2597448 [Pisolithus marmoratus]|nr:hypothetical protein EDC04DRAFT_2597448 [Pisolithus marmoratus]
MAKTMSKPRKSMGGTAPCVPLSGNNVGVTAIPESAPVNTQAQESTSKDLAVSHVRKHVHLDISHVNTGNITLLGKGILSGGPITMAMQILAPYFPNSGFHSLDVEFDIGNDAKLKNFHVVGVVSEEARLVTLEDTIIQLGLSSIIVFDAKDLQPVLTSNLVTGLVKCVYVHNFPTCTTMPEVLGESTHLGGHSSILLFMVNFTDSGHLLTHTKYSWGHRDICPWGNVLPIQCSQCGIVQVQWKQVKAPGKSGGLDGVEVDSEEPSVYFQCANEACGQPGGQQASIAVVKPKGIKTLNPGKRDRSAWLEFLSVTHTFT